jgi:hypothetical protein
MDPKDVGCIKYHVPHKGPNGTTLLTVFEAEANEVDGCLMYLETETTDITDEMAEAARKNRARTMAVVKKGLGT